MGEWDNLSLLRGIPYDSPAANRDREYMHTVVVCMSEFSMLPLDKYDILQIHQEFISLNFNFTLELCNIVICSIEIHLLLFTLYIYAACRCANVID